MSQSRGGGPVPGETGTSAHAEGTNSGSQYALCALGVGLVALGIVMIVWSVVPVDATNSSRPGLDTQGRTSSVAFVLVGAGVAMLLLSLCLGIRNKQRRQAMPTNGLPTPYHTQLSADETADTLEERFTVPSYEEVVSSGGLAPLRISCPRGSNSSSSQLPSYEDVLESGAPEGTGGVPSTHPQLSGAAAAPTGASGGRWRLLPLKIRRIKSEKLRVKRASSVCVPPADAAVFSIEPLTPPPQYDDKPPAL